MKKALAFLTVCIVMNVSNCFGQAIFYPKFQDTIKVYNWYHPFAKDHLHAAEGEYDETQLKALGWTNKTFAFNAYKTPGENRVAVYDWENPKTNDHKAVPYFVLDVDEAIDKKMEADGYANKHLKYYRGDMKLTGKK